ncbi:hypothetical protein RRG08_047592 [Elysia crispata]|uniref:Uncharacterized protein n=1 Tax=Elysia crispata TaxID=231223 RepID=A0AAE0XNQ0_9GAST|nr:hypothetical protein RRG08_047592 [Elysia crispata]
MTKQSFSAAALKNVRLVAELSAAQARLNQPTFRDKGRRSRWRGNFTHHRPEVRSFSMRQSQDEHIQA